MRRLPVVLAALLVACAPDIPNTPPPQVVTARFDPSAVPPVVPTPNDLASNAGTGKLTVPVPANASPADIEFITGYLNELDGFPGGATATASFDGELTEASVGASSVRVLDLSDSLKTVETTFAYADKVLQVKAPAGGWVPGHAYAIALVGGDDANGLKSGSGIPVVGSSTWSFLRSKNSLLRCDGQGQNCVTATELIPSSIKDDPAKRLADQTAKATQLEALRLKYRPILDAVEATGVARSNIVLAWSFKIVGQPRVLFDPAASPPRVPTPNDLAIDPVTKKVKAPIDPASSAAQQEFTADYLNSLNGFPVSAVAEAKILGGPLEPDSVNEMTVRLVQLKGTDDDRDAVISYDAAANSIKVAPPAGNWGKGRTFAIAILGGDEGVQRQGGGTVAPSDAWALARSQASLVTCDDLASADCAVAITAAPLDLASAKRLEALRRGYAPVLDLLQVPRKDVALLWVFSTVDQPEATFDPGASVIPFPNDILRSPTTGLLTLPKAPGISPTQAALIDGLNTLDGFSLTAAAVSENSDGRGVLDVGTLNVATFDAGTGFVRLTGQGTLAPQVRACLNCASSRLPDGGTPSSPPQLQFVPVTPLEEKTTYAAYLTTALRDEQGREVMAAPAFALARLRASLVAEGKSTVAGVSDAQAAALEPLRLGLKPMLDALETMGVPRTQMALAWAYSTQSTVSVLRQVYALPTTPQVAGVLPAQPTYLLDVTTQTRAALNSGSVPNAAVGKYYQGNVVLPFVLTGPGGTINPNPLQARLYKAPFVVTVPASAPPNGGHPVVIFGHGLGRNRTDAFGIANAFAQAGFATVAIDAVFHGERSTCVGANAVLKGLDPNATDDYACANPVTQACDASTGRCLSRDRTTATACTSDLTCVAAGQGFCAADGKCEMADFRRGSASGPPSISAWNFLNLSNFFATRDDFRYAVLDFAQLIRVLKDTGANSLNQRLAASDANSVLNPANLNYAGQSLGTFHGTLTAAVSPDLKHVALNVPGSDQVQVLLTAPGFTAQRNGLLANLGGLGLTPGTPGFDAFMVLAKTIIDPADSQNASDSAVNPGQPSNRKVYVQYIEGDEVLPNPTTLEWLGAATRRTNQPQTFFYSSSSTPPVTMSCPTSARHGFLLSTSCDPLLTQSGQSKLATFLATGVAP